MKSNFTCNDLKRRMLKKYEEDGDYGDDCIVIDGGNVDDDLIEFVNLDPELDSAGYAVIKVKGHDRYFKLYYTSDSWREMGGGFDLATLTEVTPNTKEIIIWEKKK